MESRQEILHESWEKRFYLDGAVRLIALVDNMARINIETALSDEISQINLSLRDIEKVSDKEALELSKQDWRPPEVWPIQRATMFLVVNPWRAKFCPTCGKRLLRLHREVHFVAMLVVKRRAKIPKRLGGVSTVGVAKIKKEEIGGGRGRT